MVIFQATELALENIIEPSGAMTYFMMMEEISHCGLSVVSGVDLIANMIHFQI